MKKVDYWMFFKKMEEREVRAGQQVQQSAMTYCSFCLNMLREVRAVSLSVFCSEFQSFAAAT